MKRPGTCCAPGCLMAVRKMGQKQRHGYCLAHHNEYQKGMVRRMREELKELRAFKAKQSPSIPAAAP